MAVTFCAPMKSPASPEKAETLASFFTTAHVLAFIFHLDFQKSCITTFSFLTSFLKFILHNQPNVSISISLKKSLGFQIAGGRKDKLFGMSYKILPDLELTSQPDFLPLPTFTSYGLSTLRFTLYDAPRTWNSGLTVDWPCLP